MLCPSAKVDGPFLCARISVFDSCIAANPAAFGIVYNLLSGLTTISHASLQVPTSGNPEQATGSYLAGIAGVRISTPLFGTGFNFCIGVVKASAPLLFRTLPAIQGILADIQCVIDVTRSMVFAVCCRPVFWQLSKGGNHHPKCSGLAPARISGVPFSYMVQIITVLVISHDFWKTSHLLYD